MADLKDGESTEVKGSSAKPYVLKNVGGVYSCTCPAWRNQSVPIEKRSCKHLRRLRGEEAERERVGQALPPAKTEKTAKDGPPLLLAQSWDNATDLTDWWMSEKLDGVRAYWDGKQFLSRQGNVYHAPEQFIAVLPDFPLDGELWLDRRAFQRTVSIVRRQDKSDEWWKIRYMVFDAPAVESDFETRLALVRDTLTPIAEQHAHILLHAHHQCTSLDHLRAELARVEEVGGEGLMLREPRSRYEVGRSSTLLKVKRFHDAEAVVVAHQQGKGKFKGMLGALEVELPGGERFKVGTGLSEAQRKTPPPLGCVITFRYQELSDAGIPRFPSFLRVSTAAGAPAAAPAPAKPHLKPAAATTPAKPHSKPAAASATSGPSRYFELSDGTSHKFWEITVSGADVAVRYGRIGSDGQRKVKSHADAATAQQEAAKLIEQKTAKGYTEATTAADEEL